MRFGFIYTRKSNEKEGFNEEAHLRACRNYLAEHDIEEYEHYHEIVTGTLFEDESGNKRKGIKKIEALLRAHEITDVVFYSIDRAARTQDVGKRFLRLIFDLGGKVHIAKKNRAYETFTACWNDNKVEMFLSEWDRDNIVEKMVYGLTEALEVGSFVQQPKYGYRLIKKDVIHPVSNKKVKKAVPIPVTEEVEVIKELVRLYLETPNNQTVARKLNGRGIKGGHGGQWTNTTVRNVIDSIDLYAGQPFDVKRKLMNGERFNGTVQYSYPPIISEQTALAVKQRKITVRKRESKIAKPLNGIIYCDCGCKTLIIPPSKKRDFQVMCYSHSKANTYRHNGKPYETDVCKGTLTIKRFLSVLVKYLDSTLEDETAFWDNLKQQVIHLIMQRDAYLGMIQHTTKTTEKLKEKRDSLLAQIESFSSDDRKELFEVYKTINSRLQKINSELGGHVSVITGYQDEITKIESVLTVLDIPVKDLPNLREFRVKQAKERRIPYNGDGSVGLIGYFNTGGLIREKTISKAKSFIGKVRTLRTYIENENWEALNLQMTKLGLRMYANFKEPDVKKRIESIRVAFDFDVTSQLSGNQVAERNLSSVTGSEGSTPYSRDKKYEAQHTRYQ